METKNRKFTVPKIETETEKNEGAGVDLSGLTFRQTLALLSYVATELRKKNGTAFLVIFVIFWALAGIPIMLFIDIVSFLITLIKNINEN